jgi:hypothetical protein
MAFKQEDVEKFEHDWDLAMTRLEAMANNSVVSNGMYQDFKRRVQSLESLVIDISLIARSDKD